MPVPRVPPQNPVHRTIDKSSSLGAKLPYPMRPLLRALPASARAQRMSALLHHGHIARVLDFGIAKATSLPGSIQSGALKGKVPYIN